MTTPQHAPTPIVRPSSSPARTLTRLATSVSLVVACGASVASADTIFVNADQILPTSFQTGSSWAFSFKSLQDALAEALPGDEVWVAQGVYRPTTTTNRSATFQIPSGVRVLGGFDVGATSHEDADPLANPTLLTGEIGAPGIADNSFHVVSILNATESTVLCGFTITRGNANGVPSNLFGGGLLAGGGPSIVDCLFIDNHASGNGAALALLSATAGTDMDVVNCVFAGNVAGGAAAAEIQNGTAKFMFCTIRENVGGGIRFLNASGAGLVANCILRDNTGTGSLLEQQIKVTNSNAPIVSCNIAGGAGTGLNCIDADPLFVDAAGPDGLPGTLDDDVRLRGASPCIDRASTAHIPSDLADVDGDGVFGEQLPMDLGGVTRRTEDFLVPNGPGANTPAPDIGAFEFRRPRTILVDKDATGANTGLTWQDAYTSLQSAISELNDVKFGGPGEVWIAEGTYKPTTGTNQTLTFHLPVDGQIYGGFAGGELERSQRDWVAHPTILSGEIGNAASTNDNSDTVVTANGDFYENDTLLDGVIVTGGNGGTAGGIYVKSNAAPTIRHCRIIGNLTGVVFEGNQFAEPVLDNCIVSGNGNRGVDITFSSAQVTNCTIAFNTAGFNSGAGIKCDGGTAAIVNCLVFGNSASGNVTQAAQIGKPSGDGLVNSLISCCAIQGFNTGYPNDVNCFAIGADGGCVDANGADNVAGTLDDDFSPTACSDVLDAGDNAVLYPDLADYDDDGDTTEALDADFADGARRVDLPTPNTGLGAGAVDIGAFERQALVLVDADYDDDGIVDGADLANLLGAWATSDPLVDLTGDCFIDGADITVLLGAWG